MHPGSGPSNRDNDVYFPEIRSHLLRAGIAVASFDKRGVGGSSGDWRDAGITEQADDVLAVLDALVAEGSRPLLGLFGHSQGAWVVIEAAGRSAPAMFVISKSGPGVSPAVQDRFSLGNAARRAGHTPDAIDWFVDGYDVVAGLLRRGASWTEARAQMDALGFDADHGPISFVAGDEGEWGLAARILDHDPRPATRFVPKSNLECCRSRSTRAATIVCKQASPKDWSTATQTPSSISSRLRLAATIPERE